MTDVERLIAALTTSGDDYYDYAAGEVLREIHKATACGKWAGTLRNLSDAVVAAKIPGLDKQLWNFLRDAQYPTWFEDHDAHGDDIAEIRKQYWALDVRFDLLEARKFMSRRLERARRNTFRWTPLTYSRCPSEDVRKAAQELIECGYRALARKLHPDAGGTTESMQELNAAVTWLREKAAARA